MFYFSAVRLFTISSLIFSAVILAATMKPDAALVGRSGTCVVGCNTGTIMASRLVKLNEDLQPKYQELDKYRANGADVTGVLNDIRVSVGNARSEISSLEKDLTGLNNGKNEQIRNEFMKLLKGSIINLDPLLAGDPSGLTMKNIEDIVKLVGGILKELPDQTYLRNEAMGLLQKIKDKAKDFWKQIIDIVGGNDEEISQVLTCLAQELPGGKSSLLLSFKFLS
ncbi:hypothetical protein RhiTH_009951 [Rhizoctonia solani]